MRVYFKMKIDLSKDQIKWIFLWIDEDIIPELDQFYQNEDHTKKKLKISGTKNIITLWKIEFTM